MRLKVDFMSELTATYTIKQTENDTRPTCKEWLLLTRIRQAKQAGHKLLIVELQPDLCWRVAGKKEG